MQYNEVPSEVDASRNFLYSGSVPAGLLGLRPFVYLKKKK